MAAVSSRGDCTGTVRVILTSYDHNGFFSSEEFEALLKKVASCALPVIVHSNEELEAALASEEECETLIIGGHGTPESITLWKDGGISSETQLKGPLSERCKQIVLLSCSTGSEPITGLAARIAVLLNKKVLAPRSVINREQYEATSGRGMFPIRIDCGRIFHGDGSFEDSCGLEDLTEEEISRLLIERPFLEVFHKITVLLNSCEVSQAIHLAARAQKHYQRRGDSGALCYLQRCNQILVFASLFVDEAEEYLDLMKKEEILDPKILIDRTVVFNEDFYILTAQVGDLLALGCNDIAFKVIDRFRSPASFCKLMMSEVVRNRPHILSRISRTTHLKREALGIKDFITKEGESGRYEVACSLLVHTFFPHEIEAYVIELLEKGMVGFASFIAAHQAINGHPIDMRIFECEEVRDALFSLFEAGRLQISSVQQIFILEELLCLQGVLWAIYLQILDMNNSIHFCFFLDLFSQFCGEDFGKDVLGKLGIESYNLSQHRMKSTEVLLCARDALIERVDCLSQVERLFRFVPVVKCQAEVENPIQYGVTHLFESPWVLASALSYAVEFSHEKLRQVVRTIERGALKEIRKEILSHVPSLRLLCPEDQHNLNQALMVFITMAILANREDILSEITSVLWNHGFDPESIEVYRRILSYKKEEGGPIEELKTHIEGLYLAGAEEMGFHYVRKMPGLEECLSIFYNIRSAISVDAWEKFRTYLIEEYEPAIIKKVHYSLLANNVEEAVALVHEIFDDDQVGEVVAQVCEFGLAEYAPNAIAGLVALSDEYKVTGSEIKLSDDILCRYIRERGTLSRDDACSLADILPTQGKDFFLSLEEVQQECSFKNAYWLLHHLNRACNADIRKEVFQRMGIRLEDEGAFVDKGALFSILREVIASLAESNEKAQSLLYAVYLINGKNDEGEGLSYGANHLFDSPLRFALAMELFIRDVL